jgi:histidinol-phosphatase (PHP family)
LLVDYHTHTKLCKHGEGVVEDYIEYGIQLGLKEIGCSEHIPMPDQFDSAHRMSMEEFLGIYKPSFLRAQEKYDKKIAVRLGIEAEFFPGTESYTRQFIKTHHFDYVIGSVHFLGEWGFDNPTFVWKYDEMNIDDIYEEYFTAVADSARSGLFDILGHCDLVKKFGHRPSRNFEEIQREMLKVIKKNDLCIEINTSGLRKPAREIYPSTAILALAKEYRIPLTLASDAHRPEDVGSDFDIAYPLIEEYGHGKMATFTQRKRTMVKLK